MIRRCIIVCVGLSLLSWAGCGDASPTLSSNDSEKQEADESQKPLAAPPVATLSEEVAETQPPPPVATAEPPPNLDSVDTEPDNPMPKIDPPPFRLLLPTEAGPLLVDLDILIDDVPLTTAYNNRINQILSNADTDGDKSTSWDEFLDHLESDAQQFGRNIAGNRGQRRNRVQLQDRNRNRIVEFDEAVNVIFREAGFDVPFRLVGTDYYRGRKKDSKLFAAIDTDDSGGLSQSEINASSMSLLRLDLNTDQRIDLPEIIAPVDNNDDPAWNGRRSNRYGTVATDLYGYVDWSMMSYSLDDLRRCRPFDLTNNPIDQLDEDGDKSISKQEVKAILQEDPDLILTASLSANPSGQAKLSVRWARNELLPMVQDGSYASTVTLADQQLSLCISLTDRRSGQNQIPAEAFAMLDANSDGELDEAEIPDQVEDQYPLKDFDEDGNGKLTLDEINNGMAGKSPIWSVQLRGRGAEFPDVLFAYLDANHDLNLSTREIMSAPSRLQDLPPADDELTADRVPGSFMVQIVRGDPQLQGQLFQYASPTKDPSNTPKDTPRWATRMDANLDGEISQLEFVGTAKQFRRLDTNEDAFIDITEVHSAGNSK